MLDDRILFSAAPSSSDLLSLLLFLLLTVSSAGADCVPSPFSVRVGNVSLTNTQVARGLGISVGTPGQPFAFLPQWPLNNTFVYPTGWNCGTDWAEAGCMTFRGGLFDKSKSTSVRATSTDSYPTDSSPYPSLEIFSDTLTLTPSINVTRFSIGMPKSGWGEQGYHPQAAIGLGRNSTLLNALVSTGKIASRSWAMFWGRQGATADAQMDGNFVFGGYDRAKASGDNFTQGLVYSNPACGTGMLVTITDISLDWNNGTTRSLYDGSQSAAMSACIVPDYPVLMTIPYDPYFKRFSDITGDSILSYGRSFGINYYGMLYPPGESPLSSGLKVRIPNDQLVIPNLTIDKTTGAILANASAPELVLNSMQQVNADDLPQLGRQFLSGAYVMVNQDAGQFTLWAAKPTTEEDLVAVNPDNRVYSSFCAPGASNLGDATQSTSTSSPTQSAASNSNIGQSQRVDDASSGLSSGAIAGIVVGGVAGIALVAAGVFFAIIKRRRRRQTIPTPQTAEAFTPKVVDLTPRAPQELPGTLPNGRSNERWELE
ncbi:hypothetical protein KXV79_001448 [Aspergillus fumigatus]|nr:hypothetical protein KXX46_003478 [Aspergillus fumigatus]KAH2647942.1 hypothetical protein KXV79_001448 [Aspergillus fumigatus]KAH3001270.1 hypothetical protein KXV72_006490 [Aspergillus fumigatus]KAH3005314.1 hypothetical protein KXV73_000260 [Aspergillus fumigatus]KAH3357847.1 hypothetical protein KXW94_001882 [Aspergillus fumigatus]